MYIMGENPMLSDPNITHVEEGLRALDFLVVQDIFLSESALLADVVLPAAASLEKDGTFTNTERRVQHPPIVEPPGQAWPDWRITGALVLRWRPSWIGQMAFAGTSTRQPRSWRRRQGSRPSTAASNTTA